VASTSAALLALGQKRGTSSTAARMSRASSRASATPAPSRPAVSSVSTAPNGRGSASAFTEVLLVGRLLQRLAGPSEITIEDALEIVQREVDAMIRDAVLRKIVGADLRRPIAGANLGLPHARAFGFLLGDLRVEQSRAQHLHRPELVLQL